MFGKVLLVLLIAFLLYLLMILPRLSAWKYMEPLKGVLYAHRGLHDNQSDAPENSLKAFQKAVDAGYGIEMDVQLSRDNVPVVFHDFTLRRMARGKDGKPVEGKVADYTLEELQSFHLADSKETIPTFRDFLELVDGRVPLIIELKIENADKDPKVCPLVDDMLREYKGIYCIESFNPRGLLWYKRNHPDVARGQLSDEFWKSDPSMRGFIYWAMAYLLTNFLTRPDFIAYNHLHEANLSRLLCRSLYHHPAVAWTIKSQQQLEHARGNFDLFIFDSFLPAKGPKDL